MSDTWVTLEHIHTVPGLSGKAGYCNQVSREFCKRHNISWNDLIKNGGLWASVLEATGDALALRLVDWARGELIAQEPMNG